jgi:hypothetical protein
MKTLLFICAFALFGNIKVTPEDQAKKFCDCLKAAEGKKTEEEKTVAKRACLQLDEKLMAELNGTQESKKAYKEKCNECMTVMADEKQGIKFDAAKSTEEKTKDVCGCMTKAKETNDRRSFMYCSQLQSRYAKTISEDSLRMKFNQNINLNCQ